MPILFLIRHGENEYTASGKLAGRLPGVQLSAAGRAQAQAVAQGLAAVVKLKAVYSSPLDRTMETALHVAEAQGLKVQLRPGLIETELGKWEGQSIKRLKRQKLWQQLQQQPSRFRFPGGESMPEQQARLVGEVEALLGRHKAKEAFAVVGHADPIKLVVAYYLGLPLDHFQRILINTASVSVLHFDGDKVHLAALNQRFSVDED